MARANSKAKIPLESKVEGDFLKKLKKLSVVLKVRKMNGLGYRSWPDRLILGPGKFFCWIEFKRPILGKLSPGQEDLFEEFRSMDHVVHVEDNADHAIEVLCGLLRQHGVLP